MPAASQQPAPVRAEGIPTPQLLPELDRHEAAHQTEMVSRSLIDAAGALLRVRSSGIIGIETSENVIELQGLINSAISMAEELQLRAATTQRGTAL